MRTIEFRGKGLKNDRWLYGNLSYLVGGSSYITAQRIKTEMELNLPFKETEALFQEVITESVGQFIGRFTKKGDKLFEGDILKRTCTEKVNMTHGAKTPCDAWEIGVIQYDNEFSGFEVSVFKQKDLWYGELPYSNTISHFSWEIIGNLTDTPELTKIVKE